MMTLRKLFPGVLVAALLVPASLSFAQDEGDAPKPDAPAAAEKKGPEMDELSKKTLETWLGKTYALADVGAKTATCKLKLTVGAMGQQMEADASYKWDGKKGAVEFADAGKGQMLSRALSSDRIDAMFQRNRVLEQLEGCKLTAKAPAEGETDTVISVTGNSKTGIKSMLFDKDGVMTTVKIEQNTQGGAVNGTISLTYMTVDGKYLRTSETVKATTPQGEFEGKTSFTHEKSGAFHVCTKEEMTMSLGGQEIRRQTVVYSDWKFNDEGGE